MSLITLTNEEIQNHAVTFLEYQKGRALCQRMQAELIDDPPLLRPGMTLEGTVRDLSRQYEVSVSFDKNGIGESSCTCGEYSRLPGLCRHRAALLLRYIGRDHKEERVRTSPACTLMLGQYERKRRPSMPQKSPAQTADFSCRKQLRIVPRLICVGKTFQMEFRIGYDRLYVIRDLISFTRAFRNGEPLELGKNMTVQNDELAYEERSLQLVRLICLQLGSYLHHRAELGNSLAVYAEKVRTLELEEASADAFMELFAGMDTEYQNENGYFEPLQIRMENAPVSVQVAAKGTNGAHISVEPSIWKAAFGRRHLYLFEGTVCYCCGKDYSRDLDPFFRAILQKAYPKAGHMDISDTDLPAFQYYVYPILQKYLELTVSRIDLDAYASPVLTAGFYLDTLPSGEVTLSCEERYGSFSFNPVLTDEVPARIVRDRDKETAIHDTLVKYFRYRDAHGVMILEDEEDLYEFLTHGIDELRQLGDVYLTDAVQKIHVAKAPQIRVGMSFLEDMMQLNFESDGMDRDELSGLLRSYRERKKYHRLSNGDLVRLESGLSDAFAALSDGVLKDAGADDDWADLRLDTWRGMYLDSLFRDQPDVQLEESSAFAEMISRMKQARPEEFPVPESLKDVLHPYQKYGYGWMKTLQSYHFGGILADDMGLGKTIQMIALLLADQKPGRTSLIICPASLIYNWQSEISMFAPQLRCQVISGQAKERRDLLKQYQEYDVIVSSYDLVRRDLDAYQDCSLYYVVLDEAQYIKNHMTMNARAVKQLKAEYRMALTGTPIENRLSELWSIFDFLMPGYLYGYNRFRVQFVQNHEDSHALEELKQMAAPFILRRKKKDVLTDLPEKYEKVIYSGMEGMQKKLYQAAFLKLKEQLSEQKGDFDAGSRMQVLAQLTRLRQICCDPSLCFETYDGGSAKLDTCLELVSQAAEADHKVLLFSQFTSMLSIISRKLEERGIPHLMLTGSTAKEDRIALVNRFQTESVPVFLISLKAGGTGLNLTAADLVIHYDPWWNVAAQNQATDRAHRLGQEREVTVYRLIAKETIEESILKLQEKKKELSEDVLSADFSSLAAMSREELMNLIQSEPDGQETETLLRF